MNLFFITCRTVNWSVLRASKGFNRAQTVSTGYSPKCRQGSGRQARVFTQISEDGRTIEKAGQSVLGEGFIGWGVRERKKEG